ncbi:MAG: PTS IIA-like nitrogen regulatory protein PtsN [Alphaproteobacteria bacterium]|jgi:PTS system nitrogen regulatory IIA component|nr:PTS IIA-like nitrogen regulatory protein PtsN [Alphaproteobacteria bacterium]
MDMVDLLAQDGVVANLKAGSKKQALQELSQQAAALTGLHERMIFDVLLQREKLGTTGIGRGIAIPHGKMQELERLHGIFARLPKPIDFDAIDEQPVDLIFLLLAPESAGADHLKALARISRLLRDEAVCAKLRGADDPEALFALLTVPTVSPAA